MEQSGKNKVNDLMEDLRILEPTPNSQKGIERIFSSWEPDDWDGRYAKVYFDKYFREGESSSDKVYVAVIDEEIIGVTGYCPEQLETKGIYWLGWHYVYRGHQGNGCGSALLKHVIRKLKSKRARKLFVYTSSDPFYLPAIGLYRKMGFAEEGVLKDFYGKGEHQFVFGINLR